MDNPFSNRIPFWVYQEKYKVFVVLRREADEVNVDSYVLEVDEVNVDSFADKTGKCSVPGCEPQIQTV